MGRDYLVPSDWDVAKRKEISDHLATTFEPKPQDKWVKIPKQTDICVVPLYLIV